MHARVHRGTLVPVRPLYYLHTLRMRSCHGYLKAVLCCFCVGCGVVRTAARRPPLISCFIPLKARVAHQHGSQIHPVTEIKRGNNYGLVRVGGEKTNNHHQLLSVHRITSRSLGWPLSGLCASSSFPNCMYKHQLPTRRALLVV